MQLFKTIGEFIIFLGREFMKPASWITAVFIGLVINMLTAGSLFASIVPFIVSLLVQMFSKAGVRFRNRYKDYLLMLPGERGDPAFVSDNEGRIIASAGKTSEFLSTFGLERMDDIFPGIDIVYHFEQVSENHDQIYSIELFSLPLSRWYQVRFKCQRFQKMILIWLDDITDRKNQEDKLLSLRQFSSETTSEVSTLVQTRDIFERLAIFILRDEYQAVFIARENVKDVLSGQTFKYQNGQLEKSPTITVLKNSNAPIWESRLRSRMSWAEKDSRQTEADFIEKHPFNVEVCDFIDQPITSYVNYHDGDLSIIAFNKKSEINSFDGTLMETLANTARSLTYLTELAITNDERFVQSIHGLCAAAEYSDEQTGRHIIRVNEYARLASVELGLSLEFQNTIGEVAAIHDIGKVAMPEIIKLPRLLSSEERAIIEMHTVYGAGILSQMMDLATIPDPRLKMARLIALNHHQCWNGSGYPANIDLQGSIVVLSDNESGLQQELRPPIGDEIPLEALIVSLADSYDALRGARHYKPEFSHDKAVSIIMKDDRSGTLGEDRFGSELFNLFMKHKDSFDEIYNSMK